MYDCFNYIRKKKKKNFFQLEAAGDYICVGFCVCRVIRKKTGSQKPEPYESIHENILAT